jgi:peptidoglycan biosynthesis protein MviN/MurJ (putative lipid II flippase)
MRLDALYIAYWSLQDPLCQSQSVPIVRALASYEGEGSVALFNYATRLVEFPLAIAVTFLAAVLFPRLAQSYSVDQNRHCQLIRYGVQITLGLALVAAAALIALSDAYAEFVYGHGGMENSSVATVAALTKIGLVALPLQGLSSFLTAVFNARRDTRTPLLLNGTGLVFFLVAENFGVFGQGLQALIWGMVISYGVICALQLVFLKIETISWRQILLDGEFLPGVIFAVALTGFVSHWIAGSGMPGWGSLLLACLVAMLSLIIMAFFNSEFRTGLKVRLSEK